MPSVYIQHILRPLKLLLYATVGFKCIGLSQHSQHGDVHGATLRM